jgi:thiosulfate reductase cytochrome b subunit
MKRIYMHPLPVRVWHWTNAFGFILLILTGFQIRYIDVAEVLNFRAAVNLHNFVGFVLIANYALWLLYYLFSDRIKVYHPELSPRQHFQNVLKQAAFYGYGIFKGHPNPHHATIYSKFNALQSMTYQVIMMILVPTQFYTGVLLWDIKRFSGAIEFLGGVRVVDTVHVLLFIAFTGFIFVHVYLTTLGHTPGAHVKAMITGYEEVEETPHEQAKS